MLLRLVATALVALLSLLALVAPQAPLTADCNAAN